MKKAVQTLQKYWGFDGFRPAQQLVLQSVLEGKDTLALLPTGGGKSICFQVPSMMKEGICIVISPLIALMKDQVQALKEKEIKSHAIFAGMSYKDMDRIFDNCIYGDVKFLYVSPERIQTELFQERVKKMSVSYLVVDESHCISQWGYDFRPAYLRIRDLRDWIGHEVPVIALTATATQAVQADIIERLKVPNRSFNSVQVSFKRDNLSYNVFYYENKIIQMIQMIQRIEGSAIIYVRNRRKTKEIAHVLVKHHISANYYHAGLDMEQRDQVQRSWINGTTRVVVATNAFGMGIDKSDVRLVIHLDLPDSLEAYFQEAGRAGRDENKAYAVLLYNQSDKIVLEDRLEKEFPNPAFVKKVYAHLKSYFQLAVGPCDRYFDFDLIDFVRKFKLDTMRVLACLKILERHEYIVLTDSIYNPSKLQVVVDRESLYDFTLKNPDYDRIIKVLFRVYEGVKGQSVSIREEYIASFLQLNKEKVCQLLDELTHAGIIDYQRSSQLPKCTFVRHVYAMNDLILDISSIKDMKKRFASRIQSSVHYAESNQCRNILLLSYFGQKEAEACGQCDVCQGTKKREMDHAQFFEYQRQIEYRLKRESIDFHTFVDGFSEYEKEKVIQVLEYMLDKEQILKNTEGILKWSKK